MLGPHFITVDQSAECFERAFEGHRVSLGILVDLAIRKNEAGDWMISPDRIDQVLAGVAVVLGTLVSESGSDQVLRGAPPRTRTENLRIKSPLLCH